jgi:murein DD-endopeptidase MepM/ murein hydrolase activator NlpD
MTPDPTRGPVRRRLGATLALALSVGLVVSSPALADPLDEIREKMREVEEQERRAATDRGDVESRIDQLDEHLDETSAELVAADARLKETTARVEQARVVLAEAESELAAAEEEELRIEAELEVAYANEAKIEASLQANAEEQDASRDAVGAIARESYKNGGMGSVAMTLDVLTGEGDAVEEMAMARTVMRVQDRTIQRLASQEAQETAEQDRLEGVRRDIALLLAQAEANVLRKADARDEADRATTELESLEARQAADKAALEEEKRRVEAQLAAAEDESDELTSQLAALAQEKHGLEVEEEAEKQRIAQEEARRRAEAEARRLAEEEAARQAVAAEAARQAQVQAEEEARRRAEAEASSRSSARQASPAPAPAPSPPPAPEPPPPPPPPAPASSGYLDHPSNAPVTSSFGYRLHPVLGTQRLHAGMDYGGACGSPVYAPASGTVIATPVTEGGGNKLVIDHGVQRGVNLTTTYAHLQGYAVRSGSVSRGQVIAYTGTTGLSTGCHLHFETRENGIPVDPRTWL